MGCKECGKPKCNGKCGCKSPKVLQINNPAEYITFHKVSIPAAMGDSTTNPPKIGAYRNALVYYEADHTSWMYSTDGIPTKLTNGLTDYNEAVNLPQINGHTLIGNQSSSDLGLQGELTAGANIQINNNVISATDTTYTAGNGIELDDTEIKAKIGDGLEFSNNGEINVANIEQYAHFFDTVADMQNATNLINGSYAKTLGFHAKNDGGGALYKIRTITNDDVIDEGFIIEINDAQNQLIAELIIDSEINILQLGAKKDLSTNATSIFQAAIDYSYNLNYQIPVHVPSGRYLLSSLNLRKNTRIVGEGVGETYLKVANGTETNFMSITESDAYNVRLENFTIYGERDNNDCPNAIYIHRIGETRDPDENPGTATCLWLNIDTLRITGIHGNGIGSSDGMNYMTEMRLNNINVNNCIGYGFYLIGSDNHYSQLTAWACKAGGFYVAGSTETYVDCKAFSCGKGLNLEVGHGWNVGGTGNNIISCWAQENYGHGFYFRSISDCTLILKAGTNGLRRKDDASAEYSGVCFKENEINQRIDMSLSATNGTNNQVTQAYAVSLGEVMSSNLRISALNQTVSQYHVPKAFVLNEGAKNNIIVNGARISAQVGSGDIEVNNSNSANVILSGTDPGSGMKYYLSRSSGGALRFDTWDGTNWKGRPFLINYDSTNNRFNFVFGDTTKTNKIGFFGSDGDTKKTLTNPVATDEASAVALLNEVVADLIAYGLLTR